MTIQTLAEEMYKALERGKRDDGSEYVSFKNDSPEWMRDVSRASHDGMLPDDYKYEFIEEAVCVLADADPDMDVDELQEELFTCIEADVYTSNLTEWLNSSNSRVYYLDEAKSNFGSDMDGFQLLSAAQKAEKDEVAQIVLKELAQIAEDEDEE